MKIRRPQNWAKKMHKARLFIGFIFNNFFRPDSILSLKFLNSKYGALKIFLTK